MKINTRLGVLAAVLVLLAGCSRSESGAGDSGRGGGGGEELVIAFADSPSNLDVRVGNDNASGRIFDMVYSGLVKVTPTGEYAPDVAESWETPDDKTIIFKLKPNVKFQDGRPVRARDFKYTFESLLAEGFSTAKKSGYAAVAAFEAPDDRTFIIRLKEPNAGIFDNLPYMLVPEGADTNVFKSKPITAGPYKVVEFRTDDRVVLEANEQFHGGAPNIKRVIARIIPDSTTRVLEMQRGSLNFEINNIDNDRVAPFMKSDDFTVMREPGSAYQYLAFNLRDPILRKKEVRQAIAHAVNREQIVRDLLLGYGRVTDTMFPAGHWARAENVPTHAYDPAKAKSLLDAAGHRDPDGDGPQSRFRLVYRTSTDAEANRQAQMIQQQLKSVGIDVQIQSNEFATFMEDVQKGNFQLFSLSRRGISDPDFYYTIFHSSSVPPEGQNRGYYINQRVDQLIEQGRSTFNKEKRKQSYAEIQRILAEDLPYLSLYHRDNIAIMRKNVKGFEMYPSGFLLSVPKMRIE